MSLLDIEDSLLSAVEKEYGDYFRETNKSRKVDFIDMKFPGFYVETSQFDQNYNFGSEMGINVQLTAYLICKRSESDDLIANLLDVAKFIYGLKISGLVIKTISIEPADFSAELPNSYAKAINFGCLVLI